MVMSGAHNESMCGMNWRARDVGSRGSGRRGAQTRRGGERRARRGGRRRKQRRRRGQSVVRSPGGKCGTLRLRHVGDARRQALLFSSSMSQPRATAAAAKPPVPLMERARGKKRGIYAPENKAMSEPTRTPSICDFTLHPAARRSTPQLARGRAGGEGSRGGGRGAHSHARLLGLGSRRKGTVKDSRWDVDMGGFDALCTRMEIMTMLYGEIDHSDGHDDGGDEDDERDDDGTCTGGGRTAGGCHKTIRSRTGDGGRMGKQDNKRRA
ncbi:hypothetical protein BD626DRAFT_245853 [Schizophyllum amplum]|uniref:Uncharacterized protein n=1 Tax=Schizophyllum amplum TaxID=97359 RepID=A0A550BVQ1_9AGAR|nr:hypothetical protein BD626DRAFT_245853 [Auriculariopsis ampla]